MFRVRRVKPSLLRRRRYEVTFEPDSPDGKEWTRLTSSPVTLIDQDLGVGDAWSLVRAADDAWDGQTGEWVTLYGRSVDQHAGWTISEQETSAGGYLVRALGPHGEVIERSGTDPVALRQRIIREIAEFGEQ